MVHGTKPFGKCDVVPALFHIETTFQHLNFIPIFPLRSHLVMQRGVGPYVGGYSRVDLPLQWNSILYAWIRAASFLGSAIGLLMMMISIQDHVVSIGRGLFAVMGVMLVASMLWPRIRKPSFERACSLAQAAGITEKGWAALHIIYGKELPQLQSQQD